MTEILKSKFIKRCAEVIAMADNSVRIIMMKSYAKQLGLSQSDLKSLVQPYVNLNKDKKHN